MNSLNKDGVRVFARQMARELLSIEVSQVSGGGGGITSSTIVQTPDGYYWLNGADDSAPVPEVLTCGP